jgi:hypothetical protein
VDPLNAAEKERALFVGRAAQGDDVIEALRLKLIEGLGMITEMSMPISAST